MKRKMVSVILAGCLSMVMMSCSEDSKAENENVDIDSEKIKMELCENVYIDADMTPYNVYKDGISSYYMDSYIDTTEKVNKQNIDIEGKFFKQDIFNVLNTIESNMDGKFNWDSREIIFDEIFREYELKIPHVDEEGIQRFFSYIWTERETGDIGSPEVYLRNWDKEGEEIVEGNGSEHNLGDYVKEYVNESVGEDLSFEKAEVIGNRYRSVVEQIIGEKVSDTYMCIAVNQENILTVDERSGLEGFDDIELEDEFYRCVYYRAIDGLPMKVLNCSIPWDGDGELAAGVEYQIWDDCIQARDEWPLAVDIDKDGIRFLELSAFTDIAGVYKEKQQVIDMNELLERLKEYFGVSYQLNKITIYNMELCYGGYFSDKEDGAIRNIQQPFWIVDYRYEGKQTGLNAMRLIYDAYTGQFVGTNIVR